LRATKLDSTFAAAAFFIWSGTTAAPSSRSAVLPPDRFLQVACGHTDMPRGFDGLALMVQEVLTSLILYAELEFNAFSRRD
jgi:hypothetical protein